MIAYSRGSTCLAGAASLKYRMPAMNRTSIPSKDIAQWIEQQPDTLWVGVRLPLSMPTQKRVNQASLPPPSEHRRRQTALRLCASPETANYVHYP